MNNWCCFTYINLDAFLVSSRVLRGRRWGDYSQLSLQRPCPFCGSQELWLFITPRPVHQERLHQIGVSLRSRTSSLFYSHHLIIRSQSITRVFGEPGLRRSLDRKPLDTSVQKPLPSYQQPWVTPLGSQSDVEGWRMRKPDRSSRE